MTNTLNLSHDLVNTTHYKIVNLTGQEMQTGNLTSDKQINVSSLSEGVYFLQLFANDTPLGQQKFVKSAK